MVENPIVCSYVYILTCLENIDVSSSILKFSFQVDFFWINRDQKSFEWFFSLLNQLEHQQSEISSQKCHNTSCSTQETTVEIDKSNPTKNSQKSKSNFLDMHLYMTSALKANDMKALGLQMALDLWHKQEQIDLLTGLKTRTNPGRPDWDEVSGS